VRGIFFDEDDAAAVAARLHADGYDARVERERLAGEDNDEDHPWAVLTDAPAFQLELLVDRYDGWLDTDDPPGDSPGDSPGGSATGQPAPQLPDGPRRLKREH
jgi:hypothetical protein